MSHSVPISDDLYEKIATYAVARGQQPDVLIEAWLADAVLRAAASSAHAQQLDGAVSDPLFQIAGILATGEPGWGRRHDELLAEAYGDNHADEQ